MNTSLSLAALLERFFTQRLMQQRQASPHTVSSYRDTFRQFLKFTEQRLHKAPSQLNFQEVDAPLVMAFLDHLEMHQGVSIRSRNLRLTALHSFFRFAAFEAPAHSAQIQRVLAIPSKRFTRTLVQFLTRPEVDALLAAPDQRTWSGRRDHAFILLAVQTGLRLSEMSGLQRQDIILGTGAHVRVIGKGRKERCTPIARSTLVVLKAWLREPPRGDGNILFPSARGERLSVHGVQYLLNKHRMTASRVCPSLRDKRVTVHRLRHTMAMELLQGGVDRSVIALWLGHERVETTQIYLEATIATEEKALAKNILAGWTTGSLYTWGPTPCLPEESVASKGLCRVMSGGFATRRPEFSVQNPQRRSVTRHSQEGHIVTKRMRSVPLHGRVQRERTFCDDRPEGTSSKGLDGRLNRQKDFAIRRARARFLEIADDGLADGGGEGIRFSLSPFSARDEKQALFPIQIFQFQCSHFAGAQGVNGKEKQNGAIPNILRPGSLGGGDKALHIAPGWTHG